MQKAFVAALASVMACVAGPAAAEKVGNVGAVNASAHGTPPGAVKRPLTVGAAVEKRERIETSSDGSAQIVFDDTSTMTVGRNSSVVIDDFAYKGGDGNQGMSIAKGVMRFVGGGVSHVSGAKLTTPTAVIGIRGGSALVRVGGECGTLVVHQVGVVEVAAAGESQTLDRPGFGVCATSSGVSEPFRVPAETIAVITAQMGSRAGQSGGARRRPSGAEANLALGDHRPPNLEPPSGLDALEALWAGNGLAQSRANVQNQPSPPLSPPTRSMPSGSDVTSTPCVGAAC